MAKVIESLALTGSFDLIFSSVAKVPNFDPTSVNLTEGVNSGSF